MAAQPRAYTPDRITPLTTTRRATISLGRRPVTDHAPLTLHAALTWRAHLEIARHLGRRIRRDQHLALLPLVRPTPHDCTHAHHTPPTPHTHLIPLLTVHCSSAHRSRAPTSPHPSNIAHLLQTSSRCSARSAGVIQHAAIAGLFCFYQPSPLAHFPRCSP